MLEDAKQHIIDTVHEYVGDEAVPIVQAVEDAFALVQGRVDVIAVLAGQRKSHEVRVTGEDFVEAEKAATEEIERATAAHESGQASTGGGGQQRSGKSD